MRSEIEMMRVLRVPPMGKLVIEVGGNRVEMLAEISNPKVKQRLLAAIGELIVVAGGYQQLVDAGVAPPLMPPQSMAMSGGEETAVSSPTEEQRNRFLKQLEAQRDSLKGGGRVAASALPLSPSPTLPAQAPEIAKQISIVEQIDAMLQKYVAADPELASRSIRLMQNPAGGLRINVDGQYYERPREIDDPKIQMVIKQALKEWEST